jgi:elongation factor G
MLDIKVTLIDGAYHDVDSSVLAFEIAGRAGFPRRLQKAGPKLLEPVMKVEVVTPEDYMGDVIGDLNSAAARSRAPEMRGNATWSTPCAAGQHVRLRQHAALHVQGRAQYTMQFDHYEPVPQASPKRSRRSTPNRPDCGPAPMRSGPETETVNCPKRAE